MSAAAVDSWVTTPGGVGVAGGGPIHVVEQGGGHASPGSNKDSGCVSSRACK